MSERGNVRREDEIRHGMVFESTGANRTLRGHREIVVTSVYPGKFQATVNDLRTGHGWRMSLFTIANPNRWEYTGVNAWETANAVPDMAVSERPQTRRCQGSGEPDHAQQGVK